MHHRVHRRNFLGGLALLYPDKLHFGWMGPVEMGKPVYYRVHGPTLLIEYENAPPLNLASGTGANHVHSVMRVPGNDFGEDWPRRHHQEHPHT
jgi:hypothetical protein